MSYTYELQKNRVYCHHFIYETTKMVDFKEYVKMIKVAFPKKSFRIVCNSEGEVDPSFWQRRFCFKEESYSTLFRLIFADQYPIGVSPLNRVILPVIRRVMPTIIANQIIGVSPMTAPHPSIAALRSKYWDDTQAALTNDISDPVKKSMMETILENTRNALLQQEKP